MKKALNIMGNTLVAMVRKDSLRNDPHRIFHAARIALRQARRLMAPLQVGDQVEVSLIEPPKTGFYASRNMIPVEIKHIGFIDRIDRENHAVRIHSLWYHESQVTEIIKRNTDDPYPFGQSGAI